jgi:enoyl-[acyl-carrier protein] reductase II
MTQSQDARIADQPAATARTWAMAELDRLWRRGKEFLGSRTAILGGGMTWVSERHLVSAISNAGGFGVLASGSMTPELLATEIIATQERTKAPFGVNIIRGSST